MEWLALLRKYFSVLLVVKCTFVRNFFRILSEILKMHDIGVRNVFIDLNRMDVSARCR